MATEERRERLSRLWGSLAGSEDGKREGNPMTRWSSGNSDGLPNSALKLPEQRQLCNQHLQDTTCN
jgi:hypothetical protein